MRNFVAKKKKPKKKKKKKKSALNGLELLKREAILNGKHLTKDKKIRSSSSLLRRSTLGSPEINKSKYNIEVEKSKFSMVISDVEKCTTPEKYGRSNICSVLDVDSRSKVNKLEIKKDRDNLDPFNFNGKSILEAPREEELAETPRQYK